MKRYGRSFASGCLAALAGLGVLGVQAQAQTYPTRSITMIVPFAAGGPTDVIARIVTGHMAQTLGQSIIIENVVGAGGTTATTRAARAANDGYTLITGHMGTHAAAVPLYPNLAYHPEKDFEPVALLAGTPILILGRKDFPPKDLDPVSPTDLPSDTLRSSSHARYVPGWHEGRLRHPERRVPGPREARGGPDRSRKGAVRQRRCLCR